MGLDSRLLEIELPLLRMMTSQTHGRVPNWCLVSSRCSANGSCPYGCDLTASITWDPTERTYFGTFDWPLVPRLQCSKIRFVSTKRGAVSFGYNHTDWA